MKSVYALATALVMGWALAQEPSEVDIPDQVQAGQMCRRMSDGHIECRTVNDIIQQPQWASDVATGIRVWDTIAPQASGDLQQRFCSRKKEYVLAHFQQSVNAHDLNGVIETYHWRGKGQEQAMALVDRLERLPAEGVLERSYVVQWTGSEEDLGRIPVYVRWAAFDPAIPFAYFAMRRDQGCWFMEFVGTPDEEVRMEHMLARNDGMVVNQIELDAQAADQEQPSEAQEEVDPNATEPDLNNSVEVYEP